MTRAACSITIGCDIVCHKTKLVSAHLLHTVHWTLSLLSPSDTEQKTTGDQILLVAVGGWCQSVFIQPLGGWQLGFCRCQRELPIKNIQI